MNSSSAPTNTLKLPIPPPALFFLVLFAGVAAAYFLPLVFLPEGLAQRLILALPFFAFALATGVWALSTFHRLRTSPEFGQAVSALIQQGPYRFSRNPLYVALLLLLAGFACLLNNAWLVIGVPILFVALDRLVVAR